MKRGCLSLILAGVALAQVGSQDDPIQAAVQAYYKAREHGQFDKAAAKRELARSLLDQVPADSPQLGNSVLSVAQLYSGSGLTAQALAVAQQALLRVAPRDGRIQLLQMVADFYQADRNLLQAVVYREKLVAAMDEAAAAPAAPDTKPRMAAIAVTSGSFRRGFNTSRADSRVFAYERLADLYQELGRPEAVAAINKRMVAIAKEPGSLAQYYEHQGRLDEAAAIYQKQAEQADPAVRAGALQSLANIYQQEQRYAEAADAMRQANAALNASGKPALEQQTIWNRMNLARTLNLAGQTSAGDQVFEQVLSEAGNAPEGTYLQVLNNYANYLAETKRDGQGQALLSDYLNTHANLQPQEEASLLFQLANGALRSGDSKLADQYQQAALAKQRGPQTAPPPQVLIAPDLQAAQAAINAGKVDEAFELSLQAMGTAPHAADREQAAWIMPNLAIQFVNKKQPAKAGQLYQYLFDWWRHGPRTTPSRLLTLRKTMRGF